MAKPIAWACGSGELSTRFSGFFPIEYIVAPQLRPGGPECERVGTALRNTARARLWTPAHGQLGCRM